MAAGIVITKLQEPHIPAILEIENAVHGAPWSESAFRNELDHPCGTMHVALDSGSVVGYGGMWLVVDECHIITLTVDPQRRRQGIGQKLMLSLLNEAIRQGMTCATLEVRAGNAAAIQLYERLGFVQVAVRKRYYPDNHEDGVIMWLYHLTEWEPPA